MIRSQKSHDLELAYNLYQQEHCFGLTENAVLPRDVSSLQFNSVFILYENTLIILCIMVSFYSIPHYTIVI